MTLIDEGDVMKMNKNTKLILIAITVLSVTSLAAIQINAKKTLTNIERNPLLSTLKTGTWDEEDVENTVLHYYIEWLSIESFSDLYKQADVVVKCKGINKTVECSPRENTFAPNIESKITLDVYKTYKGTSVGKITVVQRGGVYNGLQYELHGDVALDIGQTMILYLNKHEDGTYSIVGGPQGMYLVNDGKIYSVGEINKEVSGLTKQFSLDGIELSTFEKTLTAPK
jgi:hypothetical protein